MNEKQKANELREKRRKKKKRRKKTDLTFLSASSNIFKISPEAVMKVIEFSSSP